MPGLPHRSVEWSAMGNRSLSQAIQTAHLTNMRTKIAGQSNVYHFTISALY
jgi:hypothetical protein